MLHAFKKGLHARASIRRSSAHQLLWVVSARSNSNDVRQLLAPLSEPFRVVFMGRDEFSCEIFNAVYNARDVWQELHITTNADAKSGHKTVVSPLRLRGEELGLPITTLDHSKACWKSYTLPPSITKSEANGSALLIAASFGKIIPTRILNAFPQYQRLNVHGSIVPEMRGAAPVQWALIHGLQETGASVIELAPAKQGIDTGACLGVQSVPIASDETHQSLRHKLAQTGGALLVNALRDILAGRASPQEQDHARATYAPAIVASQAVVDWAHWDAAHIDRLHRGIGHQRPLTTSIPFGNNGSVRLLDVRVEPGSGGEGELLRESGDAVYEPAGQRLRIRCAGATYISVERLQTANRTATSAKDWWNGVPKSVLRDGRILRIGLPH